MTDKIMVHGMTFWGYHGALAEENALGQPFVVDVELGLDLCSAGQNDALDQTLDYVRVYEAVKEIVTGEPYRLLEALAEAIARALLMGFSCQQAMVRVKKPHVPIPGQLEYAAVEVYRNRDDYSASGIWE